jgi:hypothetical protein
MRSCRFCGEEIEQDQDGDWHTTTNPEFPTLHSAWFCSLSENKWGAHQPQELETPLFTEGEIKNA